MPPTTITYDLGPTIYDAPLTLTWTTGTGGERQWVIRKEAANQRDDSQIIGGITHAQIMLMAAALEEQRKR